MSGGLNALICSLSYLLTPIKCRDHVHHGVISWKIPSFHDKSATIGRRFGTTDNHSLLCSSDFLELSSIRVFILGFVYDDREALPILQAANLTLNEYDGIDCDTVSRV